MKVMSYNTLFGGFDGQDETRYSAQVELIRNIKPDILIVQEAKGFTDNGSKLLFRHEENTNMRGFIGVSPYTGQNTGIFVHPSFKPISVEIDAEHFHHAITILKLYIPEMDAPLTVISAHLCPYGGHVRLQEASYLMNYASTEDYTLVAGDFNSVSPNDPDPDGLNDLPSHFRTRYVTFDGKSVDRRSLEALHQAGFVDIANLLGKNNETTVPTPQYKNAEFVPFRSDYILSSKKFASMAVSYEVIKDPITDFASDHYPVVAEFKTKD